MVYILTLLLIVFLALKYDMGGEQKDKDIWYKVALVIFVLIAGFRYRIGGDTTNYLYNYFHETPYIWELSLEDVFTSKHEPLFLLLESFFRSCGFRYYVVQFVIAIFVNCLIFKYIRKHSPYVFTCLFFYFIWMYIYYNFEEIRAGISLAICLFANDYVLEKKRIKGLLLFFVAFLFHRSAIALIITPLLFFLRFNLIGYLFLILSLVFGVILFEVFGDYIMLLELTDESAYKLNNYMYNEEFSEVNQGLLAILISRMLFIIYSIIYYKIICNNNMLLDLQPLILIGCAFIMISIPIPICYRFLHYYAIYFIIVFSSMFVELVNKGIHLNVHLSLCRVLLIFVPLLYSILRHNLFYMIPGSPTYQNCYAYEKYYPYTSIFDRSINERREQTFKHWDYYKYPNREEY